MVVLLLEDDPDYADIIAHTLQRDGHEVVQTATVAASVQFARRKAPSAAILDVMLPDGSGLDACRALREIIPSLPVLFLSSLDAKADILAAFESGADDYLTKPFSPAELVARLRATLRRAQQQGHVDRPATRRLSNSGIELDATGQTSSYQGVPLNLSPLEIEILWQLVLYPGQSLSHAFLTEEIWGYSNVRDATLLKGHISSIRRKLRDAGAADDIVRTVHGVGYSFTPV